MVVHAFSKISCLTYVCGSLFIHVESLENLINVFGSFSLFLKSKILRNSLIAPYLED